MLFVLLVGLFLSATSATHNTTGFQFQMVYPGLNTTYWNENPSIAGALCDEYLVAMNISTVATCNFTEVFNITVLVPDATSSRKLVDKEDVILIFAGTGYIMFLAEYVLENYAWYIIEDIPSSTSLKFDKHLDDPKKQTVGIFKDMGSLVRKLMKTLSESLVDSSQQLYSMQPIVQEQLTSSSCDQPESINFMVIIIILSSLLFLAFGALTYLWIKGKTAVQQKEHSVEVKEVVLNVM